MKKTMLFLVAVFTLTCCKFGCDVEAKISGGLAAGVAKLAACKNPAAIDVAVKKALSFTHLCAVAEHCADRKMGTIAMIACPLVGTAAVAAIGNKLPEEFECNPTDPSATVTTLFIAACELIPL